MRVSRILMAAGLAVVVGISSVAMLSAQAKSDEDFDKLMKAVGAANGAMRKQADPKAQAVEAEKLIKLFGDAEKFWTARGNKEAADWSAAAADHAQEAHKLLVAKDVSGAGAHMNQLGGVCQQCHAKYREKTASGFAIKQ